MPPSSERFREGEIKPVFGEGNLDTLALVVVTDDPVRPRLPLRGAAACARRLQAGVGGVFVGHTVADVLLTQPCVEQDEVLIVDLHSDHILLFSGYMHRVETSDHLPDADVVLGIVGDISPRGEPPRPLGEQFRFPRPFPQRGAPPGGA